MSAVERCFCPTADTGVGRYGTFAADCQRLRRRTSESGVLKAAKTDALDSEVQRYSFSAG